MMKTWTGQDQGYEKPNTRTALEMKETSADRHMYVLYYMYILP